MEPTADLVETLTAGGGGHPIEVPASFTEGRYRVERVLGRGGQKHACLVFDTELDRLAVISLLSTGSSGTAPHLRSEAQMMARLGNHPNIVTVFDIGDENGTPFIVSEYVQAGSVADLLRASEKKALPVDLAVRISRQVADALAWAHSRGIIHRDVKPSNVWLTPSGIAKLGDFGVATDLRVGGAADGGFLCGTAVYIAPEPAQNHRAGPKNDIY
jgi:serine/threonine protein kinase